MISDNVKNIRTFKGLSRQDLSNKTGLSTVSIWQIEEGKSDPKVSTLQKLADALEVDVKIFFANSINFSQKIEAI